MANHDPSLTYTLEDFISMQISDDMTYYNFSILEVIDGVEHLDHNIVEDYIDELSKSCITVEFTQDEYKKYRYYPDLLSYDLYKTVQLDFIIMMLNDMIDPKEFDIKRVKLPYASTLSAFLNRVYSKESNYINSNRSENGLLL